MKILEEIMENKYRIIDTHAHYDDEAYDEDRAEVLKQIKEAGVEQLMNIACSKKSIETTNNLTLEYDFIYGALGIHPSDADDYNEEVRADIISKVKSNKKILAIGEIGLDYYWDENPDREVQKFVFREQMRLAEELNLPVVIHDRDAHADTLEIMKSFPNVKGVVHCFSGSVEMAQEVLKLGMYIGLGGAVTFKNAKKPVAVAASTDISRILLETDCPYMAPVPFRGTRCSSDMIAYSAQTIANIKNIDVQSLVDTATENTKRLFEIAF
jgi:TatD DNase family protein